MNLFHNKENKQSLIQQWKMKSNHKQTLKKINISIQVRIEE